MAVSKFKATCLAELERIRRTGKSLMVTKHGEPLAVVSPPPAPVRTESALGCARDTVSRLLRRRRAVDHHHRTGDEASGG